MYAEFVLPYMKRLTDRFGLVYYGCCEPVHDRLELIMEAMPNLRSVSVTPWADLSKVAEMLGDRYVYSRKPDPVPISGPTPHWERAEADLRRTYEATAAARLPGGGAVPRRLRRGRRPLTAGHVGVTGEVGPRGLIAPVITREPSLASRRGSPHGPSAAARGERTAAGGPRRLPGAERPGEHVLREEAAGILAHGVAVEREPDEALARV